MPEAVKSGPNPEVDQMFDPSNFVTSSALNGKRGVVREAVFIRHNYGGKIADEVTALKVVVTSPELEKPRTLLIAGGDIMPAIRVADPTKPRGFRLDENVAGPFFKGTINRQSNIADFLNFLKSSGFDFAKLDAAGVDSLVNQAFNWRAYEKGKGKDARVYDVPSEYVGAEAPPAEGQPVAGGVAVAVGVAGVAAPQAASDDELKGLVAAALVEALQANGGELSRSQLSTKVGPAILQRAGGQKAQAFALLINDAFLSSIEGVVYDKKTIKLAAAPAVEETKTEVVPPAELPAAA